MKIIHNLTLYSESRTKKSSTKSEWSYSTLLHKETKLSLRKDQLRVVSKVITRPVIKWKK